MKMCFIRSQTHQKEIFSSSEEVLEVTCSIVEIKHHPLQKREGRDGKEEVCRGVGKGDGRGEEGEGGEKKEVKSR